MILIIDNFDSFTYNLYQYFSQLGEEVRVVRNNMLSIEQIRAYKPTHLVISPGPSTPDEAGISLAAIKHFAEELPILGVCLGHQAIAQVFGGKVIRASKVMHGKSSCIEHLNRGVFRNLNQPLNVIRYHSLIVEEMSLPDCFEITAWVKPDSATISPANVGKEIMGIKHKNLPIEGVQFHPESILSEQGVELLSNFLNY